MKTQNYLPTIGLEVHVELKTRTKMFCSCLNDAGEVEPNKNICPVCLAHPGSLPVINLEAVKKVIKVGLALEGTIAKKSFFDRKNYFYPDLPKGFQISQYEHPLVQGGHLEIDGDDGRKKKIAVTRIHLEEDTGNLLHRGSKSLIDFNRAGVPLMELVTEPVIHSGSEARRFAEELRLLLRYLDVSSADMELGQFRVEPNISVSQTETFGDKVEIKNLNSFRSVEDSIGFEVKRQVDILDSGGKIHQHNRGWNQEKAETFEQRSKEEARDYRYFPEPDLPPLVIDGKVEDGEVFIGTEEIKKQLPELPRQRRERLEKLYGLGSGFNEILVQDKNLGDYFEQAVSEFRKFNAPTFIDVAPDAGESGSVEIRRADLASVKAVYNLITSDLRGLMLESKMSFESLKVKPSDLARLVGFFHEKKISSRALKDVLSEMFRTGKDPEEIIGSKNLLQVSDSSELDAVVEKVILNNPAPVKDFKSGKEASLQFLVGQIMKETKGRANPQVIQEMLKTRIE